MRCASKRRPFVILHSSFVISDALFSLRMRSLRLLLALAFLPAFAFAAEPVAGDGTTSKKDDRAPAAGALVTDPKLASKRFTIAPGLQCDLWAAEPLIENVVAFSFDERGRAYVV